VVSDLRSRFRPRHTRSHPGAGPVHLLQRVRTIPPAGRSMVRFWMDSKALIEGLGIQTAEQAMWPMRSALDALATTGVDALRASPSGRHRWRGKPQSQRYRLAGPRGSMPRSGNDGRLRGVFGPGVRRWRSRRAAPHSR
jgi:hypothetical protein